MERHRAIYPTSEPTYTTDGDKAHELDILLRLRDTDALFSYQLLHGLGADYPKKALRNLMRGHYIGIILGANGEQADPEDHGLSPKARAWCKEHNRYYTLALWPRGVDLLEDKGLWTERRRQSDDFAHKMYRCSFEFSSILGAKEHGLKLDFLEGVAADPRCPWRSTKTDKKIHAIPTNTGHKIIPDTPIIRLRGERTWCGHIEYDMGTEDLDTDNPQSIKSKCLRYVPYIARGGFKARFGVPNITIVFVFTKQSRLRHFLDVTVPNLPTTPDVKQRFVGMYVPSFKSKRLEIVDGDETLVRNYPPATGFAITDDYQRVGGTLNIMEIIRGSSRPSQTRQDRVPHQAEA